VWFDSTGAAVAQYEVINWQQDSDGSVQFITVGYYDALLPPHQRFVLNTENIIWAGGQLEVNCNNMFILQGLLRLREKVLDTKVTRWEKNKNKQCKLFELSCSNCLKT